MLLSSRSRFRTNFYPRPPRGGRPPIYGFKDSGLTISIHALREEGDHSVNKNKSLLYRFLSTPSARRATKNRKRPAESAGISIHALREEGDAGEALRVGGVVISIHALREEGDEWRNRSRVGQGISIHALREEGDHLLSVKSSQRSGFLSTPSARRATTMEWAKNLGIYISIHALREEGDLVTVCRLCMRFISIHALREEGDKQPRRQKQRRPKFLSTPSARRATYSAGQSNRHRRNFYPRPPRGGRHWHDRQARAL